jgi:hypothetical protein
MTYGALIGVVWPKSRPQAEPSARYRFPAVDRGDTKRGSSLLPRGSLSSICTFVSFESVAAVSELKHLAHISETEGACRGRSTGRDDMKPVIA